MKLCKTCGEEKPESEFYHVYSTKDKLSGKCKKCTYVYHREYMKRVRENRPKIKKIPKERPIPQKRNRKLFTESQYKVLAIIDILYQRHGYFPTYNEVGENLGVSRQCIEQQIKAICKKSLLKCELKE